MKNRAWKAALVLGTLLAIPGCEKDDALEPDLSVSLTLTNEFAPLNPAVKAVVQNRGTRPLWAPLCPPFSRFSLWDEEGNLLNVWDPCGPEPAAPCAPSQRIEADQVLTLYLPLPGVHWPSESCESVPMTPGRYRVLFHVPFRREPQAAVFHDAIQEISFDWPLIEPSEVASAP